MVGRVACEGVVLGLQDDLTWIILHHREGEVQRARWMLSIAQKIYKPAKRPRAWQLSAEEAIRAFARDNGGVADLAQQAGDDYGVVR